MALKLDEEPMQEPMQEPTASEETNDAAFMFDAPARLLKPSDDHRSLVIEPDVLRRLQAIGPVCVLSVVGSQRGGKSTLMNLLHDRKLQGFRMGHHMDPQTVGLWIWPRPHPRCPGLSILLVDSEGLDSPHVPQHYNWLLSAVTLLMSDLFMYQTKSSIDQSAAERLDMILKVAEHVDRAGKAGDGNSHRLPHSSRSFIWLLRDHQLQMRRSPKEELFEKLEPVQSRTLKQAFSNFDCVPLPRPGDDEVLRNMDNKKFEDLSADFREEFVVFERRLLELLTQPRDMLGQPLTGRGLADFVQQYIARLQMQKGVIADICEMPTQRELLRQMAGHRVVAATVQRYKEVLSKGTRLPARPDALLSGHERARAAAFETLQKEARAASLDGAEEEHCSQLADEQFALWEDKIHTVASSTLDPTVLRTTELKGGLLRDIWLQNVQLSRAAYDGLLPRVLGLLHEEETTLKPVELYYSHLVESLATAAADDSLGPWTSLLGIGSEQNKLLLGVAQRGNQIVLSKARSELSFEMNNIKDRLEADKNAFQSAQDTVLSDMRASADAAQQGLKRLEESLKQMEAELKSLIADKLQVLQSETKCALQERDLRMTEAIREVESLVKQDSTELRMLLQVQASKASDAITEAKDALSEQLGEALRAAESRSQARSDELRSGLLAQESKAVVELEAACASLRDQLLEARTALEEADATLHQQCQEAMLEAKSSLQQQTTDLRATLKAAESKANEALETTEASLRVQLQEALTSSEAKAGSLRQDCQEALSAIQREAAQSVDELQAQLAITNAALENLDATLRKQMREEISSHSDRIKENARASEAQASEEAEVLMAKKMQALKAEITFSLQDLEGRIKATADAQLQDLFEQQNVRLQQFTSNNKSELSFFREQLDARLADVQNLLGNRITNVTRQTEMVVEEQERISIVIKQSDVHSIWESFAHLASRLSDIQCALDQHGLKNV
eukprot:TRINITY_DN28788_c0_g1_i1.p1 TRINITY_DN28788_c0_g1~~TRINITY_DN28788_c0_g1_i1.p1  ORF type:complete len:969 (+),score=194.36 TRINITY_DN28788_c0_g1_i1:51-2957(+)